jgi:hypothetical protein
METARPHGSRSLGRRVYDLQSHPESGAPVEIHVVPADQRRARERARGQSRACPRHPGHDHATRHVAAGHTCESADHAAGEQSVCPSLRVRLFQLATEPLARRTNQGIAVSHHDEHPAHDSAMISLERAAEIEHVIHRVTPWAAGRNDIIGLLLVGSCARNAARPDSDIDLVVLTRDTTRYADSAWADELAIGELIRIRSWGPSPNNDSPRPAASKSRSTSAVPTGRASGRRPRHSPRRDRRSPHPA